MGSTDRETAFEATSVIKSDQIGLQRRHAVKNLEVQDRDDPSGGHPAAREHPRQRGRGRPVSGKGRPIADGENQRKKRPEPKTNYALYIHKVLKQVHPDCKISNKAMSTMHSFCVDMFERLAAEARKLHKRSGRKELMARDSQAPSAGRAFETRHLRGHKVGHQIHGYLRKGLGDRRHFFYLLRSDGCNLMFSK